MQVNGRCVLLKYVLALLFLLLPVASMSEIYRWIDEDGKVHFGDNPAQNKYEKVEVDQSINSYESVNYEFMYDPKERNAVRKKVVMYSTSWCGYCKKARKYFEEKAILYTEYDIEKSKAAKASYDRLGGRGVPLILVGKLRMTGFNKAGFNKLYD